MGVGMVMVRGLGWKGNGAAAYGADGRLVAGAKGVDGESAETALRSAGVDLSGAVVLDAGKAAREFVDFDFPKTLDEALS